MQQKKQGTEISSEEGGCDCGPVDCGCMRSRSRRTELEELQLQLQLKKKVVYGISSSSSLSDANNKRILNFNHDTLGYTDNFDDGKWQQGLL